MDSDDRPLETRALLALYRNHPDTAPADRYKVRAKARAREKRDMLLAWAATMPDYRLRDMRNLGDGTVAWIRAHEATDLLCRACLHREHPNDVCEWDLGEFGECQCAAPKLDTVFAGPHNGCTYDRAHVHPEDSPEEAHYLARDEARLRDVAQRAAQIGYTYGALGRDFEYVYKNVNDMLAEEPQP